MQEEFASVRATPEQVRELVLARRRAARRLHPRSSRGRAGAATASSCFSSGFRSVIDACWRAGASSDLEVASHDAALQPGGRRAALGRPRRACAICGRRCKRHDLRARHAGETARATSATASPTAASRSMADVVFARAHLARDLTEPPACPSSRSRTSTRCASGSTRRTTLAA